MDWIDSGKTVWIGLIQVKQLDWIDSGKTIGLDSFRQNNWIGLIQAKHIYYCG